MTVGKNELSRHLCLAWVIPIFSPASELMPVFDDSLRKFSLPSDWCNSNERNGQFMHHQLYMRE
ncbi:MAG TPA: hypothetical protein DCM28_15150 [Phycisphaerales bacterium]|nr:hypothetical protein [Phycisphaerales bacterium]|tara:strand:+ start:283 stop:474 length:192 start_codon:yes stop_codon:yes gene_type:complete